MNKGTAISSKERIAILDVLRGMALFGVLVGCFSEFIFYEIVISYDALQELSTNWIDPYFSRLIQVFITNKANTIFAFLFGLGFYIQWERIKEKRTDASAIYLRRTIILLLFGAFHLIVMMAWEVLFMYGVISMILFTMRNRSDKFLLYLGVFLALFGMPIVEGISEALGLWEYFNPDEVYETRLSLRQADAKGGYAALFQFFWNNNYYETFLTGSTLSYIVYALGRFMIGTYVGRKGWIQNSANYLAEFRKVLIFVMPVGVAVSWWASGTQNEYYFGYLEDELMLGLSYLGDAFAILFMAAGYISLVVLGMNNPFFAKLLNLFAPVGKMALTNYVIMCQSVNFVYLRFGPGLGLAGKIGTAQIFGIAVLVFLTLTVTSNIWLKYFRFGPLEWGWRALTYQEFPAMRRD